MTLNDLETEIVALGFNADIDTPEMLLTATNRALRDIYTHRNILKTVRLFCTDQKPSIRYKEIYCKNGKSQSFPFEGRAYSMRLCGEGFYSIVDGGNTNIIQFNTGKESKLVRGFVNVGGTIKFYGAVSFRVYDLSFYDEIYVTSNYDLPDGTGKKTFDIRKDYEDFLSFISLPTDLEGKVIEGSVLEDGRLTLPENYVGELLFTYRRLPEIVYDDPESEIDIPEEFSHVLPLLVAFYIWLDLDTSKARLYKSQYDEMIALIEKESYEKLDFRYEVKDGWA